jgi:hypothetical protein
VAPEIRMILPFRRSRTMVCLLLIVPVGTVVKGRMGIVEKMSKAGHFSERLCDLAQETACCTFVGRVPYIPARVRRGTFLTDP